MARFIAALVCHQCPEDSRIFVGQGHDGLLPSSALSQGYGPLRDGVEVVFTGEHDCFGSLNQQRAKVAVTAFSNGTKTGFAPLIVSKPDFPTLEGFTCR